MDDEVINIFTRIVPYLLAYKSRNFGLFSPNILLIRFIPGSPVKVTNFILFTLFWQFYLNVWYFLEILDCFWQKFYKFDLYAGRLIHEYIRYLWSCITSTGCFFYFGMFDMLIFWSIFYQKSCFWTFLISTFCSYFVKKFGKKILKTEKFIYVFVKVPIFRIFEKISFFHFLIMKFIIFNNLRIKLKLFWYFLYCLLWLLLKNEILIKILVEIVKLWQFCCNFLRKRNYSWKFPQNW